VRADVSQEGDDGGVVDLVQLVVGDGAREGEAAAILVHGVEAEEAEELPDDVLCGWGEDRAGGEAFVEIADEDGFGVGWSGR
jgi:sulfite reductase beta subunit-like hemoprotein